MHEWLKSQKLIEVERFSKLKDINKDEKKLSKVKHTESYKDFVKSQQRK
jgi:hypothetical protein